MKRHVQQAENNQSTGANNSTFLQAPNLNGDTNPFAERRVPSASALACNPLLLNLSSVEQADGTVGHLGSCHTSSASTSLNDVNINQMFGDEQDQVIKPIGGFAALFFL